MIPGTHTHIYKMETLPFRSPRYFLQTEKNLENLNKELKDMKTTMDVHSDEMQNLESYPKVYAILTQVIELISGVPKFMALIEEELDKFIKQEKSKH